MDVTNLLSQFGSAASGYHDAAFQESQRAHEGERFRSEQTQREAANESEQLQLSEQRRQFQAAAEDRAIAARYAHDSAPGFSHVMGEDGAMQAPTGAPAPATTAPAAPATPAPTATPPVQQAAPGTTEGTTGVTMGQPPSATQPMAASAVPGQTLSFTPPSAPVTPANAPTTPGGAPSMAGPAASQKAAPTAQAPGASGRAGLLDHLAQAALNRGDVALYNQRIAEKQKLRAEGIGEAAHLLLSGATNAEIERAFNANGSGRIMPGTLVNHGDGTVSGVAIDPATGKTFSINRYNLVHAAMSLGMIAPPTVSSHPATDRQTVTGPDGVVRTINEGGKYSAVAIRGVGAYVYNQSTGEGHIESTDGGTAQLNPTQAAGMRSIAQINNEVAGRRAQQIPGQEGNKPPLNESRVIGDASAIWLNNPQYLKNGQLNPARAHEIAVAINDKDPAVQTGHQMDATTHRMWTVVRYKGVSYALAEDGVQPGPSAASAPPAAAVTPPAVAKAPVAVPRPAAPPAAAPTKPSTPVATSFNAKGEPDQNGNFVKSGPNLVQSDDLVIKNDSQLKTLQAGLKTAIAKGDQKAIAEYNAAYAKRLASLRTRGYAKGGMVSGGRGSEGVRDDEPTQKVKGASNVKSRSFTAPPKVAAEQPIVKPLAAEPAVTPVALDDGVESKPLAFTPGNVSSDSEDTHGEPLDDGVTVKLTKDPSEDWSPKSVKVLKKPPMRQSYSQ